MLPESNKCVVADILSLRLTEISSGRYIFPGSWFEYREGLCGVAGALTASFVGRYVKRVGVRRFNFIGCGLILFAWLLFFVGENTFVGIIAGIIIIDIGMQCIQLSNQTSIFELNPRASNRINTVFMTTYFIGGSMGTFLAGSFWQLYGWHGVISIGVVLTGISLLITIFYKK